MARQQAARSWELRAIISMARLARGRNSDGAVAQLSDILRGLSEGFETADFQRAKAFLAANGDDPGAPTGDPTGATVIALRRGLTRG